MTRDTDSNLDGKWDDAAIGRYFGKTQRTGRRIRQEYGGKTYFVGGKKYVDKAEFLAWLETRSIEPKAETVARQPTNVKSKLAEITARCLEKRRAG